ncbi:MAG TPA: hypothetical protein PLB28_07450 [Bacteroidales bacterium]|nr:hypothetical protein [Bacteroidales bacterium]
MAVTLDSERTTFEAILAAYVAQFAGTGGGTSGTIIAARLSIINAVKAKIDELIPEGEGVNITFTSEAEPNISNPYDIFINVVMDEVAKELLLIAPLHVLTPTVATPTPVEIDGTETEWGKTGYIPLPADFIRLQSFKMLEWERPVTVPITTLDPLYELQQNKYTRGRTAKPVAALSWIGTQKVLEYYSVITAHTLGHFRYIKTTLPEDIQSNLVDALTWLIAEKVLQITDQKELAKLAYEKTFLCFKDMQ